MITAKGLFKSFSVDNSSIEVLKDINLEIKKGEFVSLLGRSGSGKSTLLYLLSTLDNPTKGEVFYENRTLKSFSQEELFALRNKEIGFIFQFHYLLPELTALENILMPTRKTNQMVEKTPKAMELIKMFGLESEAHKKPRQMSGGQCQRVAIARSLINNPKYLFADEPTGSLDSYNGDLVINSFSKVNQELGTTVVLVTHDAEFANRTQRQIVLVDGVVQK